MTDKPVFPPDELPAMAEALEARFRYGDYAGIGREDEPYTVIAGSIPVLLSLPHTTNHLRRDRLKYAEYYTGALGLLVQMATGCHLIAGTRLSAEDPNDMETTSYKERIRDLAREHRVDVLFDIHGAALKREFDVDLGTMRGRSFADTAPIRDIFARHGVNDVRDNDTFAASKRATVTHFAYAQLGIPSVQLEINARWRQPASDPASFASLVAAMIDIVRVYGRNRS